MARTTTALTATQIKQAKPKAKDYKLSDGGGLYLLITKVGVKFHHVVPVFQKQYLETHLVKS